MRVPRLIRVGCFSLVFVYFSVIFGCSPMGENGLRGHVAACIFAIIILLYYYAERDILYLSTVTSKDEDWVRGTKASS